MTASQVLGFPIDSRELDNHINDSGDQVITKVPNIFKSPLTLSNRNITEETGLGVTNGNFICGEWKRLGSGILGSAPFEYSGSTIATSSNGKTVAVGSPYFSKDSDTHIGMVRIYRHYWDGWSLLGKELLGQVGEDLFGTSLAMSSNGNIVAIGSSGHDGDELNIGRVKVYKFNWDLKNWKKYGNVISGEKENELVGSSIDISPDGNNLVISSGFGNKVATKVYYYKAITERWIHRGTIEEEDPSSFKVEVSIALSHDGNSIIIGSHLNSSKGKSAGKARVFRYNEISSKFEILGSPLWGNEGDHFGSSVAISGNGRTVVIGSDGWENNTGFTKVYSFRAAIGDWKQRGSIIKGDVEKSYLGSSVSISSDGNNLAIGAIGRDRFGSQSGYTSFYANDDDYTWAKKGHRILGGSNGACLGGNVKLSANGEIAVVSSPMSNLGGKHSGLTEIYSFEVAGTCAPTPSPTLLPTKDLTTSPTKRPTAHPTKLPTIPPTKSPTHSPTEYPTLSPTNHPTKSPTSLPTTNPTSSPSSAPNSSPSSQPSIVPTSRPSLKPSLRPTKSPSSTPNSSPSSQPSIVPSYRPSLKPSLRPTESPSNQPSSFPSYNPSKLPSSMPTTNPSSSNKPSVSPSFMPTTNPSSSNKPSVSPSFNPTTKPSSSDKPTVTASDEPTNFPSISSFPSLRPTITKEPTIEPTKEPRKPLKNLLDFLHSILKNRY